MSHAVHAAASGHAAQCPGGDEAWQNEGLGEVRGTISRVSVLVLLGVRQAGQPSVRDGAVTAKTLVKHVSNFATCFEFRLDYPINVIFVDLVGWVSKFRSRHGFRP